MSVRKRSHENSHSVHLRLVCGLFVLTMPAIAHHSFSAEYDAKKPITLKGVVTKVEWMNPHVYFYIDVEDENGKVTNWAFEMGPPNGLQRAGWTRNTMKIGDEVIVDGRSPRTAAPGERAFGDNGGDRQETRCGIERRPGTLIRFLIVATASLPLFAQAPSALAPQPDANINLNAGRMAGTGPGAVAVSVRRQADSASSRWPRRLRPAAR